MSGAGAKAGGAQVVKACLGGVAHKAQLRITVE